MQISTLVRKRVTTQGTVRTVQTTIQPKLARRTTSHTTSARPYRDNLTVSTHRILSTLLAAAGP